MSSLLCNTHYFLGRGILFPFLKFSKDMICLLPSVHFSKFEYEVSIIELHFWPLRSMFFKLETKWSWKNSKKVTLFLYRSHDSKINTTNWASCTSFHSYSFPDHNLWIFFCCCYLMVPIHSRIILINEFASLMYSHPCMQ